MKYLLCLLCLIVTVSGRILLKHGDDSRLRDLQLSDTIDELHNRTKQLIVDTLEEMSRLKGVGQAETNSSWSVIQDNVNSTYYSSLAEAKEIVDYVIGEIATLEDQAESIDIANCTGIKYQISANLPEFNDEQLKVALSTLAGSALSNITGKTGEWLGLIDKVQALDAQLATCERDTLCIVGIADDVIEYNLRLMEGVEGVQEALVDLQKLTQEKATLAVATTLDIFERYVCNVGAIVEACIDARIEEIPLMTTTEVATSDTSDDVSTDTTEPDSTTRVTTEPSTPSPTKYCKR